MSYSQGLAILFDGDSGNIFYAGQLVTGHVQFQTTERIKIRGIRLHVTGDAETYWEESRSGDGDSMSHTDRYRGLEEYMNFEMCLIGSRNHNSEIFLEPSVNKYPFSFMVPAELPQSFEDNIGHIRYKAKAVVDRPMRIDDNVEVRFTVIRLLDLNREPPHLRNPHVLQRQVQAGGCCCVKGFTEINATVNRGCFVPGETMRFEGEIVNRTNTDIKYSTVALVQSIDYSATSSNGVVYRTKCLTTTLAQLDRPRLRRGQTDSWNNMAFVVPQVFASRLDGCRIINIGHSVEITAVFHDVFSKSSVSCPIVIGNVPLRDDCQPSVVTSQPMGYPAPYNMTVGNAPPAYTPPIGFNTTGFQAYNYDGKDTPAIHRT